MIRFVSRLSIDNNGNIYISGVLDYYNTISGTINVLGQNFTDVTTNNGFLAKLDNSGNLVWMKLGGKMDDITIDSLGNIHGAQQLYGFTTQFGETVSGKTLATKLDSNGNLLWNSTGSSAATYGYIDLAGLDSGGNSYYVGDFTGTNQNILGSVLSSSGGEDLYYVKLDPNGSLVWAKRAGGLANDANQGTAILSSDAYIYHTGYITGVSNILGQSLSHTGNYDLIMVKLTTDGDLVWAKSFGGTLREIGSNIYVDASENVYTVGDSYSATLNLFGETLSLPSGLTSYQYLIKVNSNGDNVE